MRKTIKLYLHQMKLNLIEFGNFILKVIFDYNILH
jgi:hypothetical protein